MFLAAEALHYGSSFIFLHSYQRVQFFQGLLQSSCGYYHFLVNQAWWISGKEAQVCLFAFAQCVNSSHDRWSKITIVSAVWKLVLRRSYPSEWQRIIIAHFSADHRTFLRGLLLHISPRIIIAHFSADHCTFLRGSLHISQRIIAHFSEDHCAFLSELFTFFSWSLHISVFQMELLSDMVEAPLLKENSRGLHLFHSNSYQQSF